MANNEPKLLYKFRDWSKSLHRRTLLASAVYFASLIELNDPLEGMNHPHYNLLTDAELYEVYRKHLAQESPSFSPAEVHRQASWWVQNSPVRDPVQRAVAYRKMQETLAEDFGILSLSVDVSITSLWAYYAANHEGFAVGYDVERLQKYFEGLFYSDSLLIDLSPVEYVEQFEPWHPHTVTDEHWAKKQLCTKLKSWSHEREFRFLSMQKTRLQLAVPNDCISEVIFGLKMESKVKSEIADVLNRRALQPRLLQVNLAPDNLSLQISRASI